MELYRVNFPFGPDYKNKPHQFLVWCMHQHGQHKYMFDEYTLSELFMECGFSTPLNNGDDNAKSDYTVFKSIQNFPNKSLAIEATK
jgi:hypothetical protein